MKFLLRQRAGVAKDVGGQRAVGIGAKNIKINESAGKMAGLLAKTQHLGGAERTCQRNPIAGFGGLGIALLIKSPRRKPEQGGQTIPESRPLTVAHLAWLQVQPVGQAIGGQDVTMAIENSASHGIARNQPDAIVIGPGTVLTAMADLQPGQASDDRSTDNKHKGHQLQRLLMHAGMTLAAPGARALHGQRSASR